MKNDLILLLHRLSHLLEQQGRSHVSDQFGLTTTQALVLGCLWKQQGKSLCATDLHQQLGISKAALSVALKGLGEKEYIQVSSCPGDDRKKEITLTPNAQALYRKIRRIMKGLELKACDGLTRTQVDETQRSLSTILQNLSRSEQDGNITDGRETK